MAGAFFLSINRLAGLFFGRAASADFVRLASGYPLHHHSGAFRPTMVVPLLSLSQNAQDGRRDKSRLYKMLFVNPYVETLHATSLHRARNFLRKKIIFHSSFAPEGRIARGIEAKPPAPLPTSAEGTPWK